MLACFRPCSLPSLLTCSLACPLLTLLRSYLPVYLQALAEGRVYNAVDGCKKLGIGGDTMDKQWAAAKKAGHLVKFGGGFYAGRIPTSTGGDNSSSWLPTFVLTLYALLGK